jgi:hypothetical protein
MGSAKSPKRSGPYQMVQRGASPRAAATAYGIGQHHMRRLIREGAVTPRAIGRRSIVLFSELEAAIRDLPRTKSSKNDSTEALHG